MAGSNGSSASLLLMFPNQSPIMQIEKRDRSKSINSNAVFLFGAICFSSNRSFDGFGWQDGPPAVFVCRWGLGFKDFINVSLGRVWIGPFGCN